MAQNTAAADALHPTDDVAELDDVGSKRAEQFRNNGIETVADMAECPHLVMENIVGGFTGAAIQNQAKDVVAESDDAEDDSDDSMETRKETDAQIITVPDSVDVQWTAAMNKAAEENGHTQSDANQHYTYEKVREFANSTMFAVWDTRE